MDQMKTEPPRVERIGATSIDEKPRLRVAAYARVSTTMDDQLVSLKAQKQHYEAYINLRPDWENVGLYYDEGISGTGIEKRNGLKRLLKDCSDGFIDYIVVKSISRFSRNTVDCLNMVRDLKQKGISIYFEKENIDTGKMEGELMLSILSSLAERESKSISGNAKWSIQNRFRNGTYIGPPAYGYKYVDRKMVVDKEQAAIIRRIFAEVLDGKSAYRVAKNLNEDGIPSKRNGKWESDTIRGIIQNERYVGDMLLQKTFTDDQFKRHKNNGKKGQFLIKDHHEPIVDREVFEAANKIIEFNALKTGNHYNADDPGSAGVQNICGNKYQNRYVFSGRIICGHCNSKWKRIKMGNHYTYCCKGHIQDKSSCPVKSILEEKLKASFTTLMNKLTFGRNKVLVPYASTQRTQPMEDGVLVRINEIDSSLEAIEDEKMKYWRYYLEKLLDLSVYENECAELQKEVSNLQREKSQLAQEICRNQEKEDALDRLLKYTARGEMMTEFDPDLFTAHVDHIIAYDRNRIGFVMKCGPVFMERIE